MMTRQFPSLPALPLSSSEGGGGGGKSYEYKLIGYPWSGGGVISFAGS